MPSVVSEFRTFLRCLAAHAGARLWLALALMVGMGLLEGSGLLMLLPLLQSIGLESAPDGSGLGRMAVSILHAGHVPFTLPAVLAVFFVVMSAQAALRACSGVLNARIETSFTCFLRERLYRAMMGSDWLFFARQRSSDITQALMEELQRVGLGTQQLLALLGLAGVAAVQILIAFGLSPALTLLAVVCGAGVAFLLQPLTWRAHELGRITQEKRAEMAAAVSEHLGGMKIAKSYGREEHHLGRFHRVMHDIAAHWVRAVRLYGAARAWFEIGSMLTLSAFLFFAVAVVRMKMAELVILAFIFTRLLSRMTAIQDSWQRTMQSLPSFTATEHMRQSFLAAAETSGLETSGRIVLQREICLENLEFRYNPTRDEAALHGVSLMIPARQITAVCGPSGAGKSTLADLLLGLLRPTAGQIFIDGEPLAEAGLHAWRRSVGYVPQETFLFHETVRANLLWVRPEATEADLLSALRTAAAAEFVDRLPQGLDTVVGDRGVRLSGGERQRLALARALLGEPSVLVLDEATSALDTQNERLIQQAIKQLHGRLTVVLIAHRLSTVRMADQIVVFEKGRVAEIGRWDELCSREEGIFRQLVAAGAAA
jgi:ATP-binding cassette, subfamily C, bacterial